MAWFKSKTAAEAPTPVTPERIEAALARQELTVDRADDGAPRFYCIINGFPVIVDASFPFAVVFSASTFERLPVEREEEVLGWAKTVNAGTHFVTTVKNVDDDGIYAAADGMLFIEGGLTEEQLDEQIELMLVGTLSTMGNFCQEFDLEPGTPGEGD